MQSITLQDFGDWYGWVPDKAVDGKYADTNDRQIINSLCAFVRPARVLEIGINEGRTAELLLRCSPWIREYVGVDVQAGFIPALEQQRGEVPVAGAVARLVNDKRLTVVLCTGGTCLTMPELTGSGGFGLIYIDADHTEQGVERDTMLAEKVRAERSCIVWHDYHPDLPGVVKFLDRYSQGTAIAHGTGTRIAFGLFYGAQKGS